MPYDCNKGCFSGSAIELDDGRQLLIYTGVRQDFSNGKEIQSQCVAVGNGKDYCKYEKNPVIDTNALPDGASRIDFRDPKIFRLSDGTFCCAAANRASDGSGQILLYKSADGFSWSFWTVLASNQNRLGKMWECPDFFALGGKYVLLLSPQDMICEGEYSSGNGTACIIGDFDEKTGRFSEISNQAVDFGIDFYAPQTVLAPDGRRIMIGWMQNWDSCAIREEGSKWAGQMSCPREIFLKDGRLWQRPLAEFLQAEKIDSQFSNVDLKNGRISLDGVSGRVLFLKIAVRPESDCNLWSMRLAECGGFFVEIAYRIRERTLSIDRSHSGSRRAVAHCKTCTILKNSAELSLEIVLDKNSAEIFINGGEQTMTATFYTPQSSSGISFFADGTAKMDISKSRIF